MKTRSSFRSAFSNPRLSLSAFCSIALLLATSVRGQSALDGFDPNVNGVVYVVVVQPDGKILTGGSFTTVLGVPRNNIARLNPDGTLDTAFNPGADATVFSIAVQADGQILAGGDFAAIGGQTRNHIGRLDAATGLADSFNPNADATVFSIAVQTDGKILAGGSFTNIGGETRNHIARLDETIGLADSFNPDANDTVLSIALQAAGKILVGGDFNGVNSIGGQTRNRIARLDPTTGLADSFNPNANDSVRSIAVQADGKIVAGGFFTSIGGQSRSFIARLDATTGLADSFNPNANNMGPFNRGAGGRQDFGGRRILTSIGGQTRIYIARLDATTGLADSFNPHANNRASFNRGPGGRQDFSGRRVLRREQHRRTDSQSHRPAGNRRQARPDAQSQHDTAVVSPLRHRRAAGRQDSHRRSLFHRFGRDAQQHCSIEHGRYARHRLRPERERRREFFNRGAGGRQDFGGR